MKCLGVLQHSFLCVVEIRRLQTLLLVCKRQSYLPSTVNHGLADVQASKTARASTSLVSALASVPPPPGGCSVPLQGGRHSSTPVFHHKIREVEIFVVETHPHAKFFRHWRLRFFKQVAADSGRGEAGLHWIGEIETVKSIEELVETDPNWINFSAKLASGFMKVLSGDFLRQITLLEEKLMTKKLTLNGRQLGFLIWDKYRRDAAEVGLTEFFDLREVRIVNDDLRRFVTDWDEVMFGLLNDQDPKYLLSLFDEQVKKCNHFKQVYNL